MSCSCSRTVITLPSSRESFNLSNNEREDLIIKANNGDTGACRRLAEYYSFIESNEPKENFWLRKGAELGDTIAQWNLSFNLIESKNISDQQEAILWLTKAAEKNHIYSCLRLAEIYESGKITERDLSLAKKYYKKASVMGNVTAVENLSDLYFEGKGCAPDKPKAFALLSFAKTLLDKRSVRFQEINNKQKSMHLSEAEKKQAKLELDILVEAYSKKQKEKESKY